MLAGTMKIVLGQGIFNTYGRITTIMILKLIYSIMRSLSSSKVLHKFSVAILLTFYCCKASPPHDLDDEGFVKIFDEKTLDGWEGDPTYWSVREGALFGEITPETIIEHNTFIIWQGDMPSNFELKIEYRVSDRGNSGINYRSELVKGVPFALRGYQADLNGGGKDLVGSNYEERRRTTLASQGEIVVVLSAKNSDSLELYKEKNKWIAREVTGSLGSGEFLKSEIRDGDWNEFHLIIKGNRLKHIVNGVLMSDVTDNDPVNRRMDGLLGVQVHVGPPMTIEYRNIRIKELH